MLLLALALALGSLAANTALAGSTWHPNFIHASAVPSGERIYLAFKPDGQVVGNGSCNHFFSVYTITGNSIQIGPILSTKKGCPGKFELETAFFSALQAARTYQRDDHMLVLFDESGQELARFVETDGA
jgi:heat shock protein HslJ